MRRALNLSSNVARQNTCAFDHFSCACAPDGRTNIVGGESGRVHFLQLVEVDTKTQPSTAIQRSSQSLLLRQQVEVARYVQRLSETARRRRVAVLSQTYGTLAETDGRAFEEALTESRKVDTHG